MVPEKEIRQLLQDIPFEDVQLENAIVALLAAAIRDAYERAANICDACKCRDPQECSHELLADRIRALKGEG